MKLLAVAGAFALFVGATSFIPTRATTSLKCPAGTPILFPDAPDPVYVLDAKVVHPDTLKTFDPKKIESIEIICAVQLHEIYGIKARRSGVIVFTAPGPRAVLKTTVDSVEVLQRAYHAKHGRFAKDAKELNLVLPDLITLRIVVTEAGDRWTAQGVHRYMGEDDVMTVSGGVQK